MPVRRRQDKRRAGEVRAWAEYFEIGCDLLWDLETIGLTETTAEPVAEETWHRIGHAVIAYLENMYSESGGLKRPIWAEEEFGPPGGRR